MRRLLRGADPDVRRRAGDTGGPRAAVRGDVDGGPA
jgi:hypothetical protein